MSTKQAISLAKQTYNEWSDHNAPRLGASVAFYSLLSFAPLLLLVTALIALVFDQQSAHGALVNEARQIIGDRGAETVDSLLKNAQKPSSGVLATVIAFITLLFGASGVFTELHDALNVMWDVKPQASSGLGALIKQRLFSFGMVLSVGFLLLVSLMISAALAYVGHAFGQLVPMPPFVLQAINFIVSLAVITLLFALMFKYVPDTKISWRDVAVGAVGTALLFTIGKLLLALYLGKAGVGSTYGAAGSLVAVVVWIYYSAQIFFFGAEFTHVYAQSHEAKAEAAAKAPTQEAPVVAEPARALQAMAAAASSGSARGGPVPAPAAAAAIPSSQPSSARIQPQPAPVLRKSQTKPRLLMALSIGIILGRVFSAVPNRRVRVRE